MNVAILGSGPSGLIAAHAVERAGHTPIIISRKIKSEMFGAMYLHRPIPGIHWVEEGKLNPDFWIDIIKVGNRDGYAYNVYGSRDAACSWYDIPEIQAPAWDLHTTYEDLWCKYESSIHDTNIDPNTMRDIISSFGLVICTIPAPSICLMPAQHQFEAQKIWVVHGYGHFLIDDVNDGNMMYYNGLEWDGSGPTGVKGHDWYRFSQIKRYQAWEYSRATGLSSQERGDRKVSEGSKPLRTNCTCWTDALHFHRLGRFGKWQKGVLTHHSYQEARDICSAWISNAL